MGFINFVVLTTNENIPAFKNSSSFNDLYELFEASRNLNNLRKHR